MPTAVRDLHSTHSTSPQRSGVTKLTNCRLIRDSRIVHDDLWISSTTGRILDGQKVFFQYEARADRVIDLGGRIVAPGLIDVQLNGGFGVDFSKVPEDITTYAKGVNKLNENLVRTGVTAYCPSVVSQKDSVYHRVLPYLRPSGHDRDPLKGSESLGAHCEGPFLNPTKNGIHSAEVVRAPLHGFSSLQECYGASNLRSEDTPIKYITIAPEQQGAMEAIRELRNRGITVSIGHSEATFEEASVAVESGAVMITHLFNGMRPLHHRNPGIFGVLGKRSPAATPAVSPMIRAQDATVKPKARKPFFGIIADGIHLHPTSVTIAWSSHPNGMILVTDAMSLAGLPDGIYDWTNGEKIRKVGALLTLEGTEGKIAGSAVSLIECVNNFLQWSGATVAQAIGAVTTTPARMLGLENCKGTLNAGTDADLVVLNDEADEEGKVRLQVEQVWKFGQCVHDKTVEIA